MIYDVTGDILLTHATAIAHGVSPMDDWKHGLALALRERWPAMYRDFRHHCKTNHPKPGEVWTWSGMGPRGPSRIVSLLTQEEPHRAGDHAGPARLEWINEALRGLHRVVTEERLESLALPRLATGVGGMDWDDVRPLIEKHLGRIGIPIYLYTTYRPGIAAEEPKLAARP